jgi:transcriptional regulator of PTS gene
MTAGRRIQPKRAKPSWVELSSSQKGVVLAVRRHGPCTRDRLGKLLNLPRSSISREVTPLLESGTLLSDPPGKRRRNAVLSVSPSVAYAIGVDIDVTRVRASLVDFNGTPSSPVREYRPDRLDALAYLECVNKAVSELLARTDASRVLGIGVGFADRVLWNVPAVFGRGNEGGRTHSLVNSLTRAFSLPVFAQSDAACAALGEHCSGRLHDVENGLYLLYSEGIGLGIIAAGRVVFGSWSDAGEIGHMPFLDDGDYCSCGNVGCLETVAAKWALVKAARQIALSGGQIAFRRPCDPKTIGIEDLCSMAASGDLLARNMLVKAGKAIGRALAISASLLDPSVIVFGGDLVDADDFAPLISSIKETFQLLAAHRTPQPIRFEVSSLSGNATVIGGAELVFSGLIA